MRILLLTHYFAPESGAPQRRWDAFIRELVSQGHEVAVVCPPPHHPTGRVVEAHRRKYAPGSAERNANGALVYRVGYFRHFGDIFTRTLDHFVTEFFSTRRASRLIRSGRFRPHVIIATAPAIPTLLAGHRLSQRFGVPLVVEMRDAWPDLVTHISGFTSGRGPVARVKKLVHEWITRMQRSAAQVVTTTYAFAKVLEARGLRNVEVIRNGTTPRLFSIGPADISGHEELRVLYMGTVGRSQGLDLVLQAVFKLRGEGIPIQCRIVGDGHERKALQKLNEQLGGPVEILGQVDQSSVRDHYVWADTTVASLKAWKPFAWTIPSKLYELLSTGRHITGILDGEGAAILTDAGGGDVVRPGSVSDLADLWRRLALNRGRLNVGPSGRQWVQENVDFRSLADKYEAVLRRIVDERCRSARESMPSRVSPADARNPGPLSRRG